MQLHPKKTITLSEGVFRMRDIIVAKLFAAIADAVSITACLTFSLLQQDGALWVGSKAAHISHLLSKRVLKAC